MWGLGSEPSRFSLNLALLLNSKITFTHQAVRDSGFVQLGHTAHSRNITYSNYMCITCV